MTRRAVARPGLAAAVVLCALWVGVLLAQTPAPVQSPAVAPQQRLQSLVDQWHAASGVPGVSVAVATGDGTVLTATAGLANRAAVAPMTPAHLMPAGSTGKTFFAALALQLVAEGRLDLDARVSRYLGNHAWFGRLPNAADITVRQIMTHSSGLVRYELHPKFLADLKATPFRVWTPEEQLAYLFDATPPFAAGQGWEYSDTNYIVLAMILEQVTGTPAYDEIRRRFLAPLKLDLIAPQLGPEIAGLAPGYAGVANPFGVGDEMVRDGRMTLNPRFEWGGGGFATAPRDLARWGQALYAGSVLPAPMRQLMRDAAVPAALGPGVRYGLGAIIRPSTPVGPTIGHSGFFPGYMSELVHAEQSGVTVAVQVNSSAGVRGLLRLAYDTITASQSRP